ncbi:MAG: type II toxin-antitoxin system HicA family toxin [Candidatus Electrothrix sp. AUS1_2]|nr:type II toxin-antitoxin system HicA family toxin [Candidatus Electrothrix sp. AUS1_2]
MEKHEKLILWIFCGQSDANILFSDLVHLLQHVGFAVRVSGSHHLFIREGVEEKPSLQKDGEKAKPYQVRLIRSIILKYGLKNGTS